MFTLAPNILSVVTTGIIEGVEYPAIVFDYGDTFPSFWQHAQLHTMYAITYHEEAKTIVYTIAGNGLMTAVSKETIEKCQSNDHVENLAGIAEFRGSQQIPIFIHRIHATPRQHQSFQAALTALPEDGRQILLAINAINTVRIAIDHSSGNVLAMQLSPRSYTTIATHRAPQRAQ